MKKNLGKILLLLLLPLALFANAPLATHTLSINKKSAYVKEAVEITFKAVQKDHEDVMFFFLEPKLSDDYKITLLNKATQKVGYHNYITTFTYLLFPLKAGSLKVDFDYTIKTASDDAVAQVYIGSRDNVKWIETVDTIMPTQSIILNIKPLDKDIELVGDFKLKTVLKSSTIDQFSTAQISYRLHGVGYVNKDFSPLQKIANVTVFEDTHDAVFRSTKNGEILEREYLYALSGDDNFNIRKVEIKAYSPRTKSFYTLKANSYPITVTKIDPNTLLDDKESPEAKQFNTRLMINTLIGIVLFIAGFVTAKLSEIVTFKWSKREKKFQDIKASSDAKGLLLIMTRFYNIVSMQGYIDRLEGIAYLQQDKSDFKKIKKEILRDL